MIGVDHSRSDWGAEPRRGSPKRVVDAKHLVVHHTAGSRPSGVTQAFAVLREVQRMHQDDRGWTDAAYNFFVLPDGSIAEGRGLAYQNGANSPSNRDTMSVCLLGNFERDNFNDMEKAGLVKLSNALKLPMIPHSEVSSTSCPGDAVRDWIASGSTKPVETDQAELIRSAAELVELAREALHKLIEVMN